ncbi:MAG: 1-acyl-sn-glycerol-3-phosphate acyltransferase [Candidatus Thermoplasmatota archaeon]|nr:1-acyl-sn-glycerol-3-phosphate acyltransferase [Candidatus Thermoplasmatota archaeon]
MSKKKMSTGADGAKDKYGNELPKLSKHASVLEYEKLLNVESPDYSRKAPGSLFWTRIAYFLTGQATKMQYRTFETTGKEKMSKDCGILTVCWHTNGLMDVAPIINHHPNYLVVGGRHDLVNHPLLGFWARRMAVQPVVRQAELMRGGCTEEEAKYLNGRSLIRLSKGISAGFGGILMPEGTSHHESHLIRLKTGPARVLTSAATIANFQGRNKPQIIPVGMHFRKRHLFRTDIWVEFCDPINYELSQELLDLGSKYDEEKWIEPPAEDVYHVRDLLKLNLEKVTPGAINWDTYRGWRLLAHLKARNENKSNLTWREEVELTRDWRDLSDQTIGTHEEQKESGPKESNNTELFSQAESAAKILDDYNLDGRAINSDGNLRKPSPVNILKSIPGVLLGVLLFPFLSISSGLILAVCNYLGNVTDEGEDARTSIHFAGFILTPFIFWPLMAAFSVFLLAFFLDIRPAIMGWEQITLFQSVPFYLAIWTFMFPLFWLINRISLTYCLDSFNDILWEIRINSLQKSKLINELEKSLESLNLKIKDY